MPPARLQLRDLPEVFPIFPLPGALLFPQGRLPLNVFESRYLAMTEDVLAADRMFGMVQPDPGQPCGQHGPAIFRVGCLGRLNSFSETADGRYLITLNGLIRFRVREEVAPQRGYRRIRADYADFADDLGPAEAPETERDVLLASVRAYFARHGFQANWDAIGAMPSAELVAALGAVCPFDVAEKQALLEAPNLADRQAALIALLRMGAHDAAEPPADSRPS